MLKKYIGFLILALSLVCTVIVFSIPFSNWDLKWKTIGIASAMVTGKVLFGISVPILGKPVINSLKQKFLRFKRK
jgi:multisubunit Na+/H+ antiporter MnhB subunit